MSSSAPSVKDLEAWIATTIGEWSQHYCKFNFAIFPVHGVKGDRCTCGAYPCGKDNKQAGKHPVTKHGCSDASTDIAKVGEMFRYRNDYNIGLATGKASGVFVLDVDAKGDVSGEDSLRDLTEENGLLPPTLVCSTGRGRHLYFAYPNFAVKNATGIAPCLDIRGDGGYVIAPPSIHASGTSYKWDNEEKINEAPAWFLDMLKPKIKERPPISESRNYQQSAKSEWGIDEVHRMLDVLDPDMSYDDWVQVGMALHEGGYQCGMWDSWSRAGSKYQAGDCDKRWRGFKPDHGITMGTLVDKAKLRGWKRETILRDKVDTSLVDKFVAQVKENKLEPEIRIKPEPPISFKPEKMEGLIGDTVRWINKYAMQPQPMLALMNALAVAGAVFGRRYATILDGRTNIYFVAIAGTGDGKDHARKLLRNLMAASGLGNFMGANAIRSDSGLLRELSLEPSRAFMIDEFGKKLQAYTDPHGASHYKLIMDALMTLYSSASSTYEHGTYADPRNKGIKITCPNMCLYGTTTETEYVKGLTRADVLSGSLNRMIPIKINRVERRRISEVVEMDESLVRQWKEFATPAATFSLSDIAPAPKIVPWATQEVDEFQWKLLLEQDKKDDEFVRALWGRRHENILKIALILAVARDKDEPAITMQDLEIGRQLVDASLQYMEELMSGHIAENPFEEDTMRVINLLAAAPNKAMTRTEIFRKMTNKRKKELEEILQSLIEQERISVERIEGKTKPVYLHRLLTS